MKILLFLIFFFIILLESNSQSTQKRNAVSIELGKTGMIYNLVFDREIKSKFGLRVGVGSNLGQYRSLFTSLLGGYYLPGKTKKLMELGLDVHYLNVDVISDDQRGFAELFSYPGYPIQTWYLTGNIGYRRSGDKLIFRVGVAPGINKEEFTPGAYLSLGIRF